ncbi:MAG: DUF692 domain-containing protein [Betaproteobacteria bacterium]|jgi:hypothetical protein
MATELTAGLGLRPAHYADALDCAAPGLWFEVHPENHMVAGGPRLSLLEAVRRDHALSLHGVGLSLAGDADPDPAHLERLAALTRRVEPALVSEHLAWNAWQGVCYPDLLPFPRTRDRLERMVSNVGRVQDALGRTLAIENPSHYLRLDAHEYGEIEFLAELARRSGCRLLLDLNNVHVSARNLGLAAEAIVDAFPADLVAEVHLAGHRPDPVLGEALLIDSHDAPVAEAVWSLYARLIARIGPRPTLIERDDRLPPFSELLAERNRAESILRTPLCEAA